MKFSVTVPGDQAAGLEIRVLDGTDIQNLRYVNPAENLEIEVSGNSKITIWPLEGRKEHHAFDDGADQATNGGDSDGGGSGGGDGGGDGQ
mgnify:CR=1 FL=1